MVSFSQGPRNDLFGQAPVSDHSLVAIWYMPPDLRYLVCRALDDIKGSIRGQWIRQPLSDFSFNAFYRVEMVSGEYLHPTRLAASRFSLSLANPELLWNGLFHYAVINVE